MNRRELLTGFAAAAAAGITGAGETLAQEVEV